VATVVLVPMAVSVAIWEQHFWLVGLVSLGAHAEPLHSFRLWMADFQYRGLHQRRMRILQGEVRWSSVVSMEDPVSSLASQEALIEDLLDPT
jgi:hypothetical protein